MQSDPVLQLYYKLFFPVQEILDWFEVKPVKSDNNKKESLTTMKHREWSFTLPGDVYLRFLSFGSSTEFRRALEKYGPIKIDVGAVYDHPVDHKFLSTMQVERKELVVDIDLTDYDDVRTLLCGCSQGRSCSTCWQMIRAAMVVLTSAFREDFGWNQIQWVFSGRRGVHAWVRDDSARKLTFPQRCALVDYLSLDKLMLQRILKYPKDTKQAKWLQMPSLVRAIKLVRPIFVQTLIHNPSVHVSSASSSSSKPHHTLVSRWKSKSMSEVERKALICLYMYPRLDVNVTRQPNHLLRCPCSVHSKTQRLATPISLSEGFVPWMAPTVEDVVCQRSSLSSFSTL